MILDVVGKDFKLQSPKIHTNVLGGIDLHIYVGISDFFDFFSWFGCSVCASLTSVATEKPYLLFYLFACCQRFICFRPWLFQLTCLMPRNFVHVLPLHYGLQRNWCAAKAHPRSPITTLFQTPQILSTDILF